MKMEGEINLHMIESRIQNIIVLDVVKNKQLAVKTKLFNNKIREHCSRNQEYVDEYLKLANAGDEVKETLASCRDTLQDCDAEIITLKQQIQRLKKKLTEMGSHKLTSCKLTDDDRNIHFKKQLKLQILKESTKVRILDAKSPSRLTGFVVHPTDLLPFDAKIGSSEDSRHKIWNQIDSSCANRRKWMELFDMN